MQLSTLLYEYQQNVTMLMGTPQNYMDMETMSRHREVPLTIISSAED